MIFDKCEAYKMMTLTVPFVRIILVDGLEHKHIEAFACTAVPHVGDSYEINGKFMQIIRVNWYTIKMQVHVDVYCEEVKEIKIKLFR